MNNISFEVETQWQIQIFCVSYPIPEVRWLPLTGCVYKTEEEAMYSLNTKAEWNDYLRLVKIQTITMVDEVIRLKDRRT